LLDDEVTSTSSLTPGDPPSSQIPGTDIMYECIV
jgi:hypothetical protein